MLGAGKTSRFHDSYLLISVKDQGFIPGKGIFLGEVLIPLDEITKTPMDAHLSDMPQLQFPLTKPQEPGK